MYLIGLIIGSVFGFFVCMWGIEEGVINPPKKIKLK